MTTKKKTNKVTERISKNKKLFLEKYPEYGSVGETLSNIGVKSRQTFYDWLKADPKFKAVYENELIPNKRDKVSSVVFKIATAENNVVKCPVCEGSGKYGDSKCHGCKGLGWVYVHADNVQLTAAFGYLNATDHNDDPKAKDRLKFTQKHEVTGKDGGPIEVKNDAKGKLLSALNRIAASVGTSGDDCKPDRPGS